MKIFRRKIYRHYYLLSLIYYLNKKAFGKPENLFIYLL